MDMLRIFFERELFYFTECFKLSKVYLLIGVFFLGSAGGAYARSMDTFPWGIESVRIAIEAMPQIENSFINIEKLSNDSVNALRAALPKRTPLHKQIIVSSDNLYAECDNDCLILIVRIATNTDARSTYVGTYSILQVRPKQPWANSWIGAIRWGQPQIILSPPSAEKIGALINERVVHEIARMAQYFVP